MPDSVIEESADEIVRVLRTHGAAFAYAFGSRVTGGARAGSDLDVAAWWAGPGPDDGLLVQADLPHPCELVVLNDARLDLAGRVAMEGRLLFDDDPVSRVRWEAFTRRVWLDESWRRDQAREDFRKGALTRGGS